MLVLSDEDYEATQDDDEDEEYRPSTAERKTAMPKKRRTRSEYNYSNICYIAHEMQIFWGETYNIFLVGWGMDLKKRWISLVAIVS